jgi:hypothetical protein
MESISSFLKRQKAKNILKGLVFFYSFSFLFFLLFLMTFETPTWVLISFCILLFITIFLTTEFCSSVLIKKYYPYINGTKEFQLEPHIFTHFIPSEKDPDISDGFRRTSCPTENNNSISEDLLYLSGDCTVFEEHLPFKETFAFQLQHLLDKYRVMNAGVSHYTSLHCYNRFVIDLVKGYRPKKLILSSSINDVLSFIHHKNGYIRPDYMHFYKPWITNSQFSHLVTQCPFSTLRFILCILFYGKKPVANWDDIALETSPAFFGPESVVLARNIFDPSVFRHCLTLFNGTCKSYGVDFILTTISYQLSDMSKEPRKTYAWGIDILNNEIREFAKENSIKLIDIAEKLKSEPEDIFNKWQYTAIGNKKRANIVSKNLSEFSDEE